MLDGMNRPEFFKLPAVSTALDVVSSHARAQVYDALGRTHGREDVLYLLFLRVSYDREAKDGQEPERVLHRLLRGSRRSPLFVFSLPRFHDGWTYLWMAPTPLHEILVPGLCTFLGPVGLAAHLFQPLHIYSPPAVSPLHIHSPRRPPRPPGHGHPPTPCSRHRTPTWRTEHEEESHALAVAGIRGDHARL